MSNRRIPEAVLSALDTLIREANEALRGEDHKNLGILPKDIITKVHDDAVKACKRHLGIVVDDLMARRIPQVLGANRNDSPTFSQPLLPDLMLPEFFSVPPDPSVGGPSRWKLDADCTPAELRRLMAHHRLDIEGRQKTLQDYVVLCETAEERGCKPDQAVGPFLRKKPEAPKKD